MVKVGFACSTKFHYFLYKNIAEYYGNKAYFIIFYSQLDQESREDLQNFLNGKQVNYLPYEYLIENDEEISVLVAPYWMPAFSLLDNRIKHVRVMYGYAKDDWNFADWNRNFDLAFTYGPYAEEKLKNLVTCISIGNPRFTTAEEQVDDNEIKDISAISFKEYKDSRKKTILYCPTWGEISTISIFDEFVHEISNEFNIIIKLHHRNDITGYNNTNQLHEEQKVFLCDETTDLFDILPKVDLVISDYSGAIFDAMLFQKPIILLDHPLGYKQQKNNTLDWKVRDLLPHISSPENIISLANSVIDRPITYEGILSTLYSNIGGAVMHKISSIIEELVSNGYASTNKKINSDTIYHFIKNKEHRLVICGAGELGQALSFFCLKRGILPVSFVDSDQNKVGKVINQIPIHSIENMNQLIADNHKFIVATTYGDSFISLFKKHGLENGVDYIAPFSVM